MSKKLTQNEKQMLNVIAHHSMNLLNGDTPNTSEESATWLWVDDFAFEMKISINKAKGIIGSLAKKEMIHVTKDAEDNLICLSVDGIKELLTYLKTKD
jgi:hypothetical protein